MNVTELGASESNSFDGGGGGDSSVKGKFSIVTPADYTDNHSWCYWLNLLDCLMPFFFVMTAGRNTTMLVG